MAAAHKHSPLDHVIDHDTLEIPFLGEIDLPNLAGLQVTRFMVMELLAAVLMIAIFVPLARRIARQDVTKGRISNLFETLIVFVREQIAKPTIGGHGADAFLPYLLTVFFFVLFLNLLGMVPGLASATGNINVTGALALLTLVSVVAAGSKEQGFFGFWAGMVPHLDLPALLKGPLWLLLFLIEIAGLFIKHIVLAVRLFANMLAGHIVLAVILGFILQAAGIFYYMVMPASLMGTVALSLLELFVAFLQAYIFTFLTALFVGTAVHPH